MPEAVLSLAIEPTQLPKHQASRLALADLVALARAVLDHEEAFGDTHEARTPDLPRDTATLERARSVRKLLAALRQASSEVDGLVPAPLAAELAELYDRADELVDTMVWATEGRSHLLNVIRAETS